jgi:hypothetical protein
VWGRRALARLWARVAGVPKAGEDVATLVAFETGPAGETWRRDFGGQPMRSQLRRDGQLLAERLGPLQFRFALHVHDGAIWWHAARVRLLGLLPLPASWFDRVRCRESEHAGRYTFEVEAALPLLGPLIRYEGWLEPAGDG